MPKLTNFLPLARKYFDHELWEENREFSKAEAWLWILQQARYSDGAGKRWINGRLVTWQKGEVLGSVRYLQDNWNWKSTGKVYRFLEYLKNEKMIEVDTEQGVNIISLCNHETYNPHLYTNGTPNGTQSGTAQSSEASAVEENGGSDKNPDNKPDHRAITEELVDYWNECNGTRLRVGKSGSKIRQVRQRLKSFDLEEIKRAIYNRANNAWVHENNQQSNWDKIFYNDKKVEHWLHREPEVRQEDKHPADRGYVPRSEAEAHAEENRIPFKESHYPSIEYDGQTYHKLPNN